MAGRPGRCAVCRSAQHALADQLLRAGKSHVTVGSVLGVSRYSVDRHVNSGHVAPDAAASAPDAPAKAGPGASPVDVLRAQMDELAAMDTGQMSQQARTQHADVLRRVANDLAKLQPVAPPGVVRPCDVDGMDEFLTTLGNELAPLKVADADGKVAKSNPERYVGREEYRRELREKLVAWLARYFPEAPVEAT